VFVWVKERKEIVTPASLYSPFANLSFRQNFLSSPPPGSPHLLDPSCLGYRDSDKLGNTFPVVVDVVTGDEGTASAVAGIVVIADGGALHELAHDVTDVVQVVDEPDGVAVVVDHGGEIVDCAVVDCASANVDVVIVSLDTIDGEGNQRGTKLIIPDSSTLVSLTDPNPNSIFPHASDSDEKLEVAWTTDTYDCSGNNGSSSVAAMDTKFVRTRRPIGPCSIRSVSPMPPSTLLLSSPNPQYIHVPDCLGILPVQVVDVANGGTVTQPVSAVAGVVEVDDEGAALLVAHDVTVLVMGDVTVNGDAKDQAVDPHGGDPYHQLKADSLDILNLSSDFFVLQVKANFLVHQSTPSFSRTSKSSFSTSVQQLPVVHATFPLFLFGFSNPFTTLFPLHRRSIFRVFPSESVPLLQHYHLATVPFSQDHLTR
jgi:hypothetical protein